MLNFFGKVRRARTQERAEATKKEREEWEKLQEEVWKMNVAAANKARQAAIPKFPEEFGFSLLDWECPRDWEGFAIETVLRRKAKDFKNACTRQEALMARLKEDPSSGVIVDEYRAASQEVDRLKKDFWDSWNIANAIYHQNYSSLNYYLEPQQ